MFQSSSSSNPTVSQPQRVLRSSRQRYGLVLAIFVVALLPRVWGIGAHLPEHFHPDEDKEIRRALALANGEVDLQRMHKGTLFALLTLEYGALYGCLYLTGTVSSPDDFAQKYIAEDMSWLLLLSRLTVAIAGAACVVLAYRIAKQLAGVSAGVVAALLLLLFSPHLDLSREGRLDVPLCFAVLLVWDLSLSTYRSPTTWRFLGLTCASAMMVSTKSSGAPFLLLALPPFWRWLTAADSHLQRVRRVATAFGCACAVVAICNYALLHTVFTGVDNAFGDMNASSMAEQTTGTESDRKHNYLTFPGQVLGVFVLLAVLIYPLGSALRKHWRGVDRCGWVILAMLMQLFLVWRMSDLVSWRYVLPSLCIFMILAAVGIRYAAQAVPVGTPRKIALAALTLILWVPHASAGIHKLTEEFSTPTTVAAREWIDAHVAAGSRIAIEGKDVFPSQYMPRLRHTRESLERRANELAQSDPGKATLLRRYWFPTRDVHGYHLELYGYSRDQLDLDWFQRNDITYVVVHDVETPPESNYAQRVKILTDTLAAVGATELAQFSPADGYSGRAIRVYQLPKDSD